MVKQKSKEVELLHDLKEKYDLTWPQVAEALGISLSWLGDLYTSRKPIPKHLLKLIEIFHDNQKIFEKYKFKK